MHAGTNRMGPIARPLIHLLCCIQLTASHANATAPPPDATSAPAYSVWGQYRYVYKLFFKLYDATLYAPAAASTEALLAAEVPFKLEFQYLRSIEKFIIIESAARLLSKNLSPSEEEQIAQRVSQINAAYTTVHSGDSSSLRYQPGTGTILSINNVDRITVPGRDFAQHYFKIWLGPQPMSAAMKSALLLRD
jgi:hypothetical protein